MIFIVYAGAYDEEFIGYGKTIEEAISHLEGQTTDVNLSNNNCDFYRAEKIKVKIATTFKEIPDS